VRGDSVDLPGASDEAFVDDRRRQMQRRGGTRRCCRCRSPADAVVQRLQRGRRRQAEFVGQALREALPRLARRGLLAGARQRLHVLA